MNLGRIGTLLLTLSVLLMGQPSMAQNGTFPDRPIKIIISFPPGGGSDALARVLARPLSEALGQPVIVESLPGAYGSVSGSQITRAAPGDGHVLWLVTSSHFALAVAMQAKLPYSIPGDFTPITQVALAPIVLLTHPSLGVKSYSEFTALIKDAPAGKYFYGTYGAGSGAHFVGEYLMMKTGMSLTHVPYKGSGPLANDLLAGHVKIGLMEANTAAPLVRSGKLHPLAVATPKRAPNMPDIPTLSELGFPFDLPAWYGVVGPKNMPPAVLSRLTDEFRKILKSEDIANKFTTMGLTPMYSTPAEFKTIVEQDIDVWSKVAKAANIKVD